MKSSKIVFVMPFHYTEYTGGAEIQSWIYARELSLIGNDVYYISQSLNGKTGREIIEGVTVFWIKPKKHFEFFLFKHYKKILSDIKPDIIIQRMTNYISGKLGMFAKKHKLKYLWICTDNKIPEKLSITKNYFLKRESTFRPYYWIKWTIFLFYTVIVDFSKNIGIKNCTIAFSQNDYQKSLLKNNYNKDSELIYSCHFMPEINISINNRFRLRNILWTGNFGKHKRPELFLEIYRKLESVKDMNFIMIGEKTNKSSKIFLNDDLTDNFQCLGRLPFDENLKYFDRATLFINTAVFSGEGFPNTYVQAWLRGVPVLSMEVDPDDIIKKNGLGIIENDIERITSNIIFLLNDFNIYREYSLRCHEYAKKRFQIKPIISNFHSKYIDPLNKSFDNFV